MSSVNILLYAFGSCTALVFLYAILALDLSKPLIEPSASEAKERTEPQRKATEKLRRKETLYDRDWWKDPRGFELERRAIFSKEWVYVSHKSAFQKAGDYRTFEIAGFSFVVVLGKDQQLRTFHNVCRHRAYAVTKKEVGSSTVLGCRYHGWSYDTRGKLIKAPEFDNVEGFDKSENGLWEVNTEVWESMVFVNFDNRGQAASLSLKGQGQKLRRWKVAKMKVVGEWKMEGAFNWKLIGSLHNLEEKAHSYFDMLPIWNQNKKEATNILRNTIVRRLECGKILFIRVVPKSPTTTTLEYSIFARNPTISERETKMMKDESSFEVRNLVSKQRRLLRGQETLSQVDILGQAEIRQKLQDHVDEEKKASMAIHPASRSANLTLEGKADDDFCRELEEGRNSTCSINSKEAEKCLECGVVNRKGEESNRCQRSEEEQQMLRNRLP